ncbi:MAG: type II secretion system protein [Candidatus Zixiibacteriota bacterium]
MHRPQPGFTLIEAILVIVIIGIMATVALRSLQPAVGQARVEATTQEMDLLAEAIAGDESLVEGGIRVDFGYVGDVGALPPNLDALVTNPGGYSTWDGPYIRSAFTEDADDFKEDAWGNSYTYTGGVTITSSGGGSTITKQFAENASDLTSNTVTGNVCDGLGAGPGSDDTLVTVTIFYPDGSGEVTSSSTNPSAAGAFSFTSSITIGNHLLRAVYSTTDDTTSMYVSVTPGVTTYCELRFAGSIW